MALYITTADLIALQDADTYVKLFDKDGDGQVSGAIDEAYVEKCIAIADSKVKMKCYSAFGADFDAEGGTVDEAIKAMVCAYTFVEAVKYSPLYSSDEKTAFAGAKKDADEFFTALVKDFNNRVRTSAVGRAQPLARTSQTQTTSGEYTMPFNRAADRKDPSAF